MYVTYPFLIVSVIDSDEDDDEDPEYTGLEGLTEEEKQERVKWLWRNLMLKTKGSSGVLKTFGALNQRILEFGTKRGIILRKEDIFKPFWFIIGPNSYFKKFWNIIVMVLLVYTASYAPYRMAFIEDVSADVFIFETLIDSLFV